MDFKQGNESSPQSRDNNTKTSRGPQDSSSKDSQGSDERVQDLPNSLDLSIEEGMGVRGQVSDDEGDDDADLADDLDRCLNSRDELDDLLLSEADDGSRDTSHRAGRDGDDGGCGCCDSLDDSLKIGPDDGLELDNDLSVDSPLDFGDGRGYNLMLASVPVHL